MKRILVLFLFSARAFGQTVPLPTAVATADDIADQFRNQFVTKIVDLGKNYISSVNEKSLVYSSSEVVSCNGVKNNPGERLAGIQQTIVRSENEIRERVQYNGCNGEISLIEESVTRGHDLEPLKFSAIIKGNRPLELKDNENYRLFRIANGEGEELFSVLIEKRGTQKFESFTMLGQKFLTMNFDTQENSSKVVVQYFGYTASYSRRFARWSMQNEFTPFSNTVIALKNKPVMFLDADGNQLSLSNFIRSFEKMVTTRPLKNLSNILEYHTHYFPTTESTKTGNHNQRIIEELRLAQNRVLTNTDMTLVKNFIVDLINAAELGQITDNRPKKE